MQTSGDVIRGGPGDDRLSAGGDLTDYETTKTAGAAAAFHYIYGDEGDDFIWGEDETAEQHLWGGPGHDVIYGGDETADLYI